VLADRAAALLFYVATGAAAITAVVWVALGDPDEAVTRVVTVLVISCPHALGLAIPLTTSISSALAAHNGILVKDRLALEQSRTVDAFLFDKTGTLTKGQHTVVSVAGVGIDEDELLRLAGGVESDSEHPLARAIVNAAGGRGAVAHAADFRSITGRGVEATIDGETYAVGGPALLREQSLKEPPELGDWSQNWKQRGAAVLYLVRGDTIVGGLALEDEIRPEARDAVRALQAMGRRVVMITGDAKQVAEAVERDLGVDEVFAEVLPEDKDAKVAELQARGLKVAMVGDGVNDAPALAQADLGIAIGAGTDVAIETADVVLMRSDPLDVAIALDIGRGTLRKMRQNLGWAIGYNAIALPIAAGVFDPIFGLVLRPEIAALSMSGSSFIVAANALMLKRLRLPGQPVEPTITDSPEPAGATETRRAA
jgi:Cu2+-exporting ATPase